MIDISQIAENLSSKSKALPINRKELEEMIDILFYELLFPICSKNYTSTTKTLYKVYAIILENTTNLMGRQEAEQITDSFISYLPTLKTLLYKEAQVYLKNDPAAKSIEEIILTYPGFYAVSIHRISHFLFKKNVPIIPRFFTEYAHSKVGIDIHPGATIGNKLYIDHGTGIVIGETTIIGNNIKIYQGVTLGALFVDKKLENKKRHPTIEDNVVIYAGATILGGNTTIGHDSTIGGNTWITKSIVPYSIVFNTAEVRIKTSLENEESFSYTI